MRAARRRVLGLALLVAIASFVNPGSSAAGDLVAVDANHVAIQGYDTVAYFTDGKAVKGSNEFLYVWDHAKWFFASAAHRDMFSATPDQYAPQFGGFCARAMMHGVMLPANPEAWIIVDGKLYMVSGDVQNIDEWKANAAANIQRAEARWPAAQNN
jgi:hypothetical protein